MKQYSAFSYKQGNSFLHRCPALLKILLIPVISIAVFKLPVAAALLFIIVQTALGIALNFTLRELFCDLKAVIYYAVILIFAKLIGAAFSKQIPQDFLPTLILLVKLFCVLQTASLVYKTSTSLQLRQAFGNNAFSETLGLFICFIPQVSKNWEQIKSAWYARGGKKSIRMLCVLLPVLFSVGMKQAWNSARALTIRKK